MDWIFYFFFAWGLSYLLNFFVLKKFFKKEVKQTKRLGGVAIILSFLTVLFFSEVVITNKILALFLGTVAILFFGLLDDFKNINWKGQFIFQFFLALLIIFFGFEIDFISFSSQWVWQLGGLEINFLGATIPLISSVVLLFWVVLIINAVNWADGSDGLAVAIGTVSAVAIFFVSLRPEVNQPAVAIMSIIFVGALLGFGWFNFPPAKLFAGTSGSYFIGFFLAVLAVLAGTKIATLMTVLALPVLDAGWVIYDRFKDGQSVFKRDVEKRHFHYRLRDIGWDNRQICWFYSSFLFLMFLLGVFFSGKDLKMIILFLEVLLIWAILFWMSRKTEGAKKKISKNRLN
jgi:UDP-GlcNAc:undecaprenyl-phosphate GlcNAc-1-phosphate transferase